MIKIDLFSLLNFSTFSETTLTASISAWSRGAQPVQLAHAVGALGVAARPPLAVSLRETGSAEGGSDQAARLRRTS